MTIFQDSHHFSRTLGSLWWQSLKTAITSAELWAVFDDNLSRQPSLQQNFGQSLMTIFKDSHHFSRTLGSLWWQSFKTAITSAELSRQCLITMFNDSAFFERTLRGRFREKHASLYSSPVLARAIDSWKCSRDHPHDHVAMWLDRLPMPAQVNWPYKSWNWKTL